MGRTIHYYLYAAEKVPDKTMAEIELARCMMNSRFTWSCEPLNPFPNSYDVDAPPRQHRDRELPCVSYGFTKVRDDEWNAFLVVQFLLWLSRKLPEALVAVHDEGDYLVAPFILLRAGIPSIDADCAKAHFDWLEQHRGEKAVDRFHDRNLRAVRCGFFKPLSVADVLSRPEFERMPIPILLIREDVSSLFEKRLLELPWQSAWMKEAA